MGTSPLVKVIKTPCTVNFDNPDVFFLPEKRDAYIIRHKHELARERILSPLDTTDSEQNVVLSEQGNPVATTEDSKSTSDCSHKKTKRVTFKSDYIRQEQMPKSTSDSEQTTMV